MIVREVEGKIYLIQTVEPYEAQENEFMRVNTTGGFMKVDSLPESRYGFWKMLDGVIVADAEANDAEQVSLVEIKLKAAKELTKASILVTTSTGKILDGDETSRNAMLAAISTGEFLGQTSTAWKLADNTVEVVTVTEIREALALAIQECGRIIMCTSIDNL